MSPIVPRVLPFAVYMLFVAIPELGGMIGMDTEFFSESPFSYAVKIGCTLAAILWCWSKCDELKVRDLGQFGNTAFAVALGLVVYVLWVNMDLPFLMVGAPSAGFDPTAIEPQGLRTTLIGVRIFGAAVAVPIAEELFWRSFLIRYLVKPDFRSVPLGLFTPLSFAVTVLFFGLEHQMLGAGIMAGVAYNLLYYRTKSVFQCVLAHAVTNLALGIHVMATGTYYFW